MNLMSDNELLYKLSRAANLFREFNLPQEFPPEARDAAGRLPDAVAPEDLAGRQDLTAEQIFTIDPPDARDFDDAVSLLRADDGAWDLGVHIADVSHYVPPEGAIDREARARATSVLPVPCFPSSRVILILWLSPPESVVELWPSLI